MLKLYKIRKVARTAIPAIDRKRIYKKILGNETFIGFLRNRPLIRAASEPIKPSAVYQQALSVL